MSKTSKSIESAVVTFIKVVKKHISDRTKRIHYKVAAEVKTESGKQKQEFWFGAHKSFLRQKHEGTGKTSIKVGCNSKQRAEIKKLVDAFEANGSRRN